MTTQDPLGIVGSIIAEKYRIERLVGEGGFAVVYRAQHTILEPAGRDQVLQRSVLGTGRSARRVQEPVHPGGRAAHRAEQPDRQHRAGA